MRKTPLKPSRKPMKRKRLSARSKATRPNLIAACDRLWAYCVRANANDGHGFHLVKCEWCPNTGTEAHHMVARRASIFLRHHLSNGVWLCPSCHSRFHNRESLTGWKNFEDMRPEDFQCLSEHKHQIIKVSQADLQDTLAYLLTQARRKGWEPSEKDYPLLSRAA